MTKRKGQPDDQGQRIEGVTEETALPPHILPNITDGLHEFDPDQISEPSYTIIFTDGDTVEMRVEALCEPRFLEPFYAGQITIKYNDVRVTSLARDHGIFRLVLEGGERAAVLSGQPLMVTNTPIAQGSEADGAEMEVYFRGEQATIVSANELLDGEAAG
jgi:hypothetical protein